MGSYHCSCYTRFCFQGLVLCVEVALDQRIFVGHEAIAVMIGKVKSGLLWGWWLGWGNI